MLEDSYGKFLSFEILKGALNSKWKGYPGTVSTQVVSLCASALCI